MDPPPPRRRSPRNHGQQQLGSNNSLSPPGKNTNNNNNNSSSNAETTTKLKIKIKRYHGVAKWTWGVSGFNNDDDEDEVCIVCQSAFEGCAPGVKYPGDESPVVFGKW
jgi:hypothetical protein